MKNLNPGRWRVVRGKRTLEVLDFCLFFAYNKAYME